VERRICLADRRGVMLGWVGKVFLSSVRHSRFLHVILPLFTVDGFGAAWSYLLQCHIHVWFCGLAWIGHQVQNGDVGGVLGKGLNSACRERFERGVYSLK
jgi:hypothetical protein